MPVESCNDTTHEIDRLNARIERLTAKVHRLQMSNDFLLRLVCDLRDVIIHYQTEATHAEHR